MSKKYVFVTYGSQRIKGVQTKAINIADFLPKEEIIVVNHGDDTWLKKAGLQVFNTDFNVIDKSQHLKQEIIDLLKNTKILIFCDFPSNMPLELQIFWYSYNNLQHPICICDNIYNTNQFETGKVYSIFYELGDCLLLTGLSCFKNYLKKFPKTELIPPFFEKPNLSDLEVRNTICSTFGIPKNKKIILHIAYNQKVLDISKNIITTLNLNNVIHLIVTTQKLDNFLGLSNIIILNKQLTSLEMRDYIIASDVVICKFGYQQLLESLSLNKPTITAGDSGLSKAWLDPQIAEIFPYFEKFTADLISYLSKLISNKSFYQLIFSKIAKLHNGEYNGAEKAANRIISLSRKKIKKRKKITKTLILSFNTKNNLKEITSITKNELFYLPLIISNRFAERGFRYEKDTDPCMSSFKDFVFSSSYDFLDPSSMLLFYTSPISYQGLAPILPYYNNLVSSLEEIIKTSDKVYLVGPEIKAFFKNFLNRLSVENKIIEI